jgi:tetratricopeptide (TPR) repeat protein
MSLAESESGTEPKTRVCLNMIVKNESKIITRLLDSVAPIIDSYCICDTGSTDDTIQLVEQYFSDRKIPGKIVQEPFRDFGYNRTFALKACEQYIESEESGKEPYYILLLDADMVFWVSPKISPEAFKRGLKADAYHVYQGTDSFYYKNTRIVRAGLGASYWGVTHEYVNTPSETKYEEIQRTDAFIKDIGDGGAKADKFERDIRLLKKGLEEHPNNDRYTFYLANSYRDHGDLDLAIETYKKRAELGGWFEEIWMSMYQIGVCYQKKCDIQSAIHWWMEAYQVFPKRLENLYEIIHHYRNAGKNQLAYLFYSMAVKQLVLNPDPNYLFTKKDVYEYKLDYEFSIIGYYCNVEGFDMTRICTKVLNSALADAGTMNNVLSNYKFYAPALTNKVNMTIMIPEAMATALQSVGHSQATEPYFVGTTPSLISYSEDCPKEDMRRLNKPRVAVCTRFVNYKINDKGGYENRDKIETRNAVAIFDANTWTKLTEFELKYDTNIDNVYVGLEDVRLFWYKGKLMYNANRGLGHGHILVEHGTVVYDDQPTVVLDILNNETPEYRHLALPNKSQRKPVEKNWVFFEDTHGNKKVIYGWYNLSIGDLELDEQGDLLLFKQSHSIPMPRIFERARGSTNGVLVKNGLNDEIWFIVHVVSYEDRRYYYHMFVAIDAATYQLKKYTPLFTFEGEKIEYTLGFFHSMKDDAFYVGYSTMDCTTKYVGFKRPAVETMCTSYQPDSK